MELCNSTVAFDREQPVDTRTDILSRFFKFCMIGRVQAVFLGREISGNRLRQNEISVGEPLHKRAGAQPIRAVIGKIGFADHEEPRDIAHQFIIDPQAAHRVMHCRIDPHRLFICVLSRDALIHIEEIAISLFDFVAAEPLDRIRKIEIDAAAARTYAPTFIADVLGRARGYVARRQIAIARINSFEIVVAFAFRYVIGMARVSRFFGNPDAAVVAQRFRHQR